MGARKSSLQANKNKQAGGEGPEIRTNTIFRRGGTPNDELFEAVYDMMVDGDFDRDSKFKIQNAHCVLMFFRLLAQREHSE